MTSAGGLREYISGAEMVQPITFESFIALANQSRL
jgi:hypothetical protein